MSSKPNPADRAPRAAAPRVAPARSALWRLSAVYLIAFLASAALFSTVALALVAGKNRERLNALAASELNSVIEKIEPATGDIGVARATAVILARSARPGARFAYRLQRDGETLAGALPDPAPKRDGLAQRDLGGGVTLTVARAPPPFEAEGEVARVLALCLGLASLAAVVIGPWAGRRVLRRVDAINRACDQVRAGDLTARAPGDRADDEFGALARHVNAMLERVDMLVVGLRDVSNRVAHDLRTPMARLKADLESAARAKTLDDARLLIGGAVAQTDDLLQTFEALLDIVEMEAGSLGGLSPMRLDEAVESAVDLYRAVAEDRGVDLSLDAGPAPLIGERSLVVRLVANLLDNAIKFSPAGGKVTVRCFRRDHEAVLIIEDAGPGIAPDERTAVLGRFSRGSARDAAPGHGLGLAVVSAVAKRHGAALTFEDNIPGLRVVVRFRGFDA